MAMDTNLRGSTSGTGAEVTVDNNLQVTFPGYNSGGVEIGGGQLESPAMFSEVDTGEKLGEREVLSPEVDKDYRLRVAHDNLMDQEQFTDTAQNTGKFTYTTTTLTATMSAGGLLTNATSITTTATGMTFGTFGFFPVGGTQTVVCETSVAFSAQPTSNVVVDFGLFLRGATTAFAPADGFYFRLSSAGMQGVVNINGVETTTSVFPDTVGTGTWAYTNAAVNRFLIQANNVSVSFWINNYKYGEIPTPVGAAFPCLARALPWSVRHANVGGAAGGVLQATFRDYRVLVRGPQYSDEMGAVGNRVFGSYQGLSGGTMGSLATYPNNTNPTSAVPVNISLTANLPAGLGGQGLIPAQAAAVTDLILGQYQVPAGTVTVQGRRLILRGVIVDAVNLGAAVATTATTIQFSLAFGGTAATLAQAETPSFTTATIKGHRRVALGFMTWPIGAAIGAQPQCGQIQVDFSDCPIVVNPGEYVTLAGKFILGTATASQTIQYIWQPRFAWE